MQIQTVNELISALRTHEAAFTVTETAAQLVNGILILRNKTYSPLVQLSSSVTGFLGNLIHHDFSDKVGGEQAGTLVQLSTTQQQRFAITPENAVFLVQATNQNYTVTPTHDGIQFTRNVTSSWQPSTTKYDQYLH